MARQNKVISNMVGGEISPLMYGRSDVGLYAKAMAKVENFICLALGGARYRNGTSFVKSTRLNKPGVFIPFQFNDSQAYLIEATDRKFRFYTQGAAILETALTITGVSAASPGVITTSDVHGLSVGDEVYIDTVVGADALETQLNGRFFLVGSVPSTTTLTLTGIAPGGGGAQGTSIGLLLAMTYSPAVVNTTSSGAYTSGGALARVYEVDSPYTEADLDEVQYAQNADTMYFAHQNYEPYKLTRSANTSWAMGTYTRTADPFTSTPVTISGATQANPAVITATAHGLTNGSRVVITAVGGMTQLNGNAYYVANKATNTFQLADSTGALVNSTAYGAYTSGGTATPTDNFPGAVTFLDSGRIMFGGSPANPQTVWASKAPSVGATDFDNFTTGTAATDAIIFTLAPIHGKVDAIQWMTNTSKYVLLGTYGALRTLYGDTTSEPISPTAVTAKSVNSFGCARTLPVSNGDSLFFVQRGAKALRSIEYDFSTDQYVTTDRNLVTEHLVQPAGYKQIVEVQGSATVGMPDSIWGVRNDGKLLGLTYKDKEQISGWHRHYLGGSHVDTHNLTRDFAKVLSAGVMPRITDGDQLWFIVERAINGLTVRSAEYMADEPAYPIRHNFLSGVEVADDDIDLATYRNHLFETQKDALHLDMAVLFDGSALGVAAASSVTPAAITGDTTITATIGVFKASHVGREIWKQYDINGNGGGRAEITAFNSDTSVDVTVLSDFDNTNSIPAGNWFLTSDTIAGLDHLEGETVGVLTDGGPDLEAVVSSGAITISHQASKVYVGYTYTGTLQTLNLDFGGVTGTAADKRRRLDKTMLRFKDSVGPRFGTNAYRTDAITFFRPDFDRPTPPFSGVYPIQYSDRWEDEKAIVILQQQPLPCTVLGVDHFGDAADE